MHTAMLAPRRLTSLRPGKTHWSSDLLHPIHSISQTIGFGARIVLLSLSVTACSLADLVNAETTSDVITPDQLSTEAGALGMYGGVIRLLNGVYGSAYGDVMMAGILSDEFQDTSSRGYRFDARAWFDTDSYELFRMLQYMRTQGLQAAATMNQLAQQISPTLVGRVYAIVGYAELLLAERFCSGVSLPTIPPGGGTITYGPGLTTSQLFERAIAHFDTAISLAGTDSLRFRRLAQVGKARAFMGLGQYRDAQEVVADVPTDFTYDAEFSAADSNAIRPQTGGSVFTASAGEGINGIDWVAAQDPRVPIKDTVRGLVRSSKYPLPTSPIVIASGIEARLIEAEADLSEENPRWLTTLNALRARLTNGAGMRLLADTTDPGTLEGRINLLFYERAFWLYATGHRHGDMRRLVRQYRRPVESVFPIGTYTPRPAIPTYQEYWTQVVLKVPPQNNTNPYSQGCFDAYA